MIGGPGQGGNVPINDGYRFAPPILRDSTAAESALFAQIAPALRMRIDIALSQS
jgi:hypothetical protein